MEDFLLEERGYTFLNELDNPHSRSVKVVDDKGLQVGYLYARRPSAPLLLRTNVLDAGVAQGLFARYMSLVEGPVFLDDLILDNGLELAFVIYFAGKYADGRISYQGLDLAEKSIITFDRDDHFWVEVAAGDNKVTRINAPLSQRSFIPVARYLLRRGQVQVPSALLPHLAPYLESLGKFSKNPPRFIRSSIGDILDYRDWTYNHDDARYVPAIVDQETYWEARGGGIPGVIAL